MFAPKRLAKQERLRDEENARLKSLGLKTGDDSVSQIPYLLLTQQRMQQQAAATSA